MGIRFPTHADLAEIKLILAETIARLINRDPEKLLNILYRLDIPEQKLGQWRKGGKEGAEALADLIIQRQLEKAISRAAHHEGDHKKDDGEEKW